MYNNSVISYLQNYISLENLFIFSAEASTIDKLIGVGEQNDENQNNIPQNQ